MKYHEIISCYIGDRLQELQEGIGSMSNEEIKSILKRNFTSRKDLSDFLKGTFLGLVDKERLSSILVFVFEFILDALKSSQTKLRMTSINRILSREMVNLRTDDYSHVTSNMLYLIVNEEINTWTWISLFSKAIQLCEQYPKMDPDKSLGSSDGADFRNNLLVKLCSSDWTPEFSTSFIKVLRDVTFTADEASLIFDKLFEQCEIVDVQDLPHYLNEMFAIAGSCKKTDDVLSYVLQFFNKKDSSKNDNTSQTLDRSALLECQGTLLMCMKDTIRHNPKISKGLMSLLKGAREGMLAEQLSPFLLGLSLLLSSDSRYHDDVQYSLRQLILKSFQTKRRLINSTWLKQCSRATIDVEKLVMEVVSNTKYKSWWTVQTELVELCFQLLDSRNTKNGPAPKIPPRELKKVPSAGQDASDLAIRSLASLFKMNEACQRLILNRVLVKIQISKTVAAHQYISLLKAMVKTYPQFLNRSYTELRLTIDDLCSMHPHNSIKLISALMPFVRSNHSFRDTLILALRKSLSSKSVDAQLSGVYGFLNFLRYFPLEDSISYSQISSQSSQSIFSAASQSSSELIPSSQSRPANNEFLCLEIMQILRRCLEQKIEIRHEFYTGICWATATNSRLTSFVIDALLRQINTYCTNEDDDTIPPIKLENCFIAALNSDCEVNMVEPIPILMESLQFCFYQVTKGNTSSLDTNEIIDYSTHNEILKLFNSLIAKMKDRQLSDFQIEKSSDYSSNTARGQKNFLILSLVVGLYQVLMEYNFLQNCQKVETCDDQLHLVQCWKTAHDVLKVQKNSHFTGQPAWQLSCSSFLYISTLINRMVYDTPEEYEEAMECLKKNDEMMKYSWTTVRSALMFLKDHGYYPGVASLDYTKLLEQVHILARGSLHYFMAEKNNSDHFPTCCMALESFDLALQYVHQWRREKLDDLFSFACDNHGGDDDGVAYSQMKKQRNTTNLISRLLSRLQRVIIGFIQDDDNQQAAVHLSGGHRKILSAAGGLLDTIMKIMIDSDYQHEEVLNKTFDWWSKVCTVQIDDLASSKHFLGSLLESSSSSTNAEVSYEKVMSDLCTDFHNQVGAIAEENTGSERSNTYHIMTSQNADQLVIILTKHIENYYGDMEWMIQQIKGQYNGTIESKQKTCSLSRNLKGKLKQTEEMICTKIMKVSRGLLELSLSSANEASSIDSLIKTFTAAFNFFASLSKFFTWKNSHGLLGEGSAVTTNFKKLCRFIGSELMPPVYEFIIYAENAQTERLETTRANHAASKKKDSSQSSRVFTTGKAKVLREGKGFTGLIYSIEQYEHHLITLGKKIKIDLMKSHHLPTSRDFRIRSDVLNSALAEQEMEKEKAGEDDDGPPSSKRLKTDDE